MKNKINTTCLFLLLCLHYACNTGIPSDSQQSKNANDTGLPSDLQQKKDATISNSDSESSIENTQKCLVGYDWVYPSGSNPSGAWKFSSDGTFNYSTTMFGGMSTWGNWKIISPGKINVSYTRTSKGAIPKGKVLTLSGCNSLTVGSTTYIKD